jgi:hypothetical protein
LDTQRVLKSEWRTNSGAPRRFYVMSAQGRRRFKKLTETSNNLNAAMTHLLSEV